MLCKGLFCNKKKPMLPTIGEAWACMFINCCGYRNKIRRRFISFRRTRRGDGLFQFVVLGVADGLFQFDVLGDGGLQLFALFVAHQDGAVGAKQNYAGNADNAVSIGGYGLCVGPNLPG